MQGAGRESNGPDGEPSADVTDTAAPTDANITRRSATAIQGARMFRRPRRPRFQRSSDVLVEPKERGRLKAAAIAAEFETGRREDSHDDAERSVLVRIGRISLGTFVILAGILMLVLPGPGWLGIAAGLAILSKDVAWADRALHFIREKIPGVPADGKIPRSTWLVIALLTASGIAVGIYIKTGA